MVGGGILGLAHAYLLARSGKHVVLFERNRQANGASVRNFGMNWPVGQPANTGSLHLAHHDDEAEVLREFSEAGYCEWLNAEATMQKSQAVQPKELKGALWSATELTVDPREVIGQLPRYLAEIGVSLHYRQPVRRIELPFVFAGDDFETLFPEVFNTSGLTRCKLQMMRTVPQPDGWQLVLSLAAGLTLRFYKSFSICQTLETLRSRIAGEKPEYDQWAIHVLASQTADGAITLGDSHEYGPEPDDLTGDRRAPGVRIVTAPGGSRMTLSFGLAERTAWSLN